MSGELFEGAARPPAARRPPGDAKAKGRGEQLQLLRRVRVGNPLRKAILRHLDDLIGGDGEWTASAEAVAADLEIGRSAFYRHQAELARMGLLVATSTGGGWWKYRLCWPNLRAHAAGEPVLQKDEPSARRIARPPGGRAVRPEDGSVLQKDESSSSRTYIRNSAPQSAPYNAPHNAPGDREDCGEGGDGLPAEVSAEELSRPGRVEELFLAVVSAGRLPGGGAGRLRAHAVAVSAVRRHRSPHGNEKRVREPGAWFRRVLLDPERFGDGPTQADEDRAVEIVRRLDGQVPREAAAPADGSVPEGLAGVGAYEAPPVTADEWEAWGEAHQNEFARQRAAVMRLQERGTGS
ncbi:MAG: hypothetical protein AAF532_03685 [Planctomycetota bacterium]